MASESGIPAKIRLNTTYGTPEDYTHAIHALHTALPTRVSTDPAVLAAHGRAVDFDTEWPPTAVVWPLSTEEVVEIVNVARRWRVPLVPYGGATGLEAQYVATEGGGICVDMTRMDRILDVHEADADLVCQPGAKWVDVNETFKQKGIPLFIPLDPSYGATIGGMISTGCSGTNAVRYGTARGEWFLNATVVLPSGEVIKTRRRSRKCSAGFDTLKLFVGAEGTLGIITEVTVRLAPLLPTRVAVVQFPDVESATRASTEALNHGVNLQCIELLDKLTITCLNAHNPHTRQRPARDSLFLKIQGATPLFIAESARILQAVMERHGGSGWEFAASEREAEELWLFRKNIMNPGYELGPPGSGFVSTDVCVPVSRLPELLHAMQKDAEEQGLMAPTIGHVGDVVTGACPSNVHPFIIYTNEDEKKRAEEVAHKMVRHALDLDGTCTGEHGVGIGKRKYLVEELGESTVEFMKRIKQSIDPLNLFNPGKLYPD